MLEKTGEALKKNKHVIMQRWMKRAHKEIQETLHQTDLALSNSLEEFLDQLAEAISQIPDRNEVQASFTREQSARFARGHGESRAVMKHYTIEGLIREYHILRQTICDVLEEQQSLGANEREVVTSLIEQAVNDAAAQYTRSLREMRERLTATLVHDLRNPISAAIMSAEMIPRKSQDPAYCEHNARRIIERLRHASSMIEDVLDVSQLSAGEAPPMAPEECDLGELVRKAVADTEQQFPGRVRAKVEGHLTGHWNPRGLRRIVENLLSNALKHGAPDSPVTVTASSSDGEAVIAVHNYGPAIPADDQASLFLPFKRSKDAQAKAGWGLGLVVVKGLAEAHGGSVAVQSSPEAGTTFTVKIPKAIQNGSGRAAS